MTHPVAVITDSDDRFILPEIPHNCLAAGVSRRQNVLNLPVPRERLDVFWGLLRQDGGGGGGQLVTPGPRDTCCSLLTTTHRKPNGRPGRGYPNPGSVGELGAEFSREDPLGYWYGS